MIALIKADPVHGIEICLDVLKNTLSNLAYAGQRRLATQLTSALLQAGYSAGGPRWTSSAAAVAVRNLVEAGELRNVVALLGNPAMDTALRHDPALIAAYEKYARPLPPQYADALAEWPDAEPSTP